MSTTLALVSVESGSHPAVGRFDGLRQSVLDGVTADNSKRSYALALDELSSFCVEQQQPVSRTIILAFRAAMLERDLASSTQRKALGHP